MPAPTLDAQITHLYPGWSRVPHALRLQCLQGARRVQVQRGDTVFSEDQPCRYFPWMLEGRVKVTRTMPNGRELMLYRVFPGESCVISAVSLLAHRAYGAQGQAEMPGTLVLLEAAHFDLLMTQDVFREHIFRLVGDRMTDLMGLVEELVSHRLDRRLASLLLGHGRQVQRTHQELADELGTVREMVSRLLKSFETQGLIALGRERVTILDPVRLRAFSG